MHALTVFAEIVHVGLRQHIRFRQHNAIALAPLEEFAKPPQHIELLLWFLYGGSFGRDNERHGVHAKPGHAQLDPKPHDLQYLSLYFRV